MLFLWHISIFSICALFAFCCCFSQCSWYICPAPWKFRRAPPCKHAFSTLGRIKTFALLWQMEKPGIWPFQAKNLGRITPNDFVKCRRGFYYTNILQNLFYKVFNIIIFSLRMWQRWRYISVCRVGPCQWLPHHSEDTHWVHGWDNQDQRCDQRDQNTGQCQKCRTCVISRGCAFLRLLDLGCIFRACRAETWKDSPQDKVGRNRIPQQGGWGHQSRAASVQTFMPDK